MIQADDIQKVKEFLENLETRPRIVNKCREEKKLVCPWDYAFQIKQLINYLDIELEDS